MPNGYGKNPPAGPFDYIALMVPAPALVAEAVKQAAPRAVINIFAGIPAEVSHPIDLDTYVQEQAYFIGTSGSTIEDMKIVLRKVTERSLDTNLYQFPILIGTKSPSPLSSPQRGEDVGREETASFSLSPWGEGWGEGAACV